MLPPVKFSIKIEKRDIKLLFWWLLETYRGVWIYDIQAKDVCDQIFFNFLRINHFGSTTTLAHKTFHTHAKSSNITKKSPLYSFPSTISTSFGLSISFFFSFLLVFSTFFYYFIIFFSWASQGEATLQIFLFFIFLEKLDSKVSP